MNKKEAILLSALKLLTEKGVHNTPMSAIAKNAGTGMGTIYNYYENKELLINEIYLDIKKKEKSVFLDFEFDKPIKTQFEKYFMSIIAFFLDNPLYFNFMEQLSASPIITEESRIEGRKAVAPIFQLLESGKKQRVIKHIATDELLQFIGGAIVSYLRWYFNRADNRQTTHKNQIEMIWDAIKE